ncbi:MAG: hypothetical protein NTV79_01055, partial [Candidatus Aureabacteria bacterium]|nr:hypothetical protein [Candidatus Auribacterota bacterium]
GKKVLSVSGTFDPVLVPAGAYDLCYRQWEHGSSDVVLSRPLTIEPGKVTEVELNTGVRLLSSDPQAKPPYRWVLADPKTKAPTATVYGEWGPLPVPAGAYSLLVQPTEHGHELGEVVPEFTVKAGQLAELEM